MFEEPSTKRAFAFFDGQNLFRCAKNAFGYNFPNYEPNLLAHEICELKSWKLEKTLFYTGIPDPSIDKRWFDFWTNKLAFMGQRGINTFSKPLRYHYENFVMPDGTEVAKSIAKEKGIDVRIAIDTIRFAIGNHYDVALIFSQDQDFNEVAREIRSIASVNQRWIKIASAFPQSDDSQLQRGIDQTDWIRIDKALYDSCIDNRDYSSK
jgi:uncharacterized LabA/DUF88 family protein